MSLEMEGCENFCEFTKERLDCWRCTAPSIVGAVEASYHSKDF